MNSNLTEKEVWDNTASLLGNYRVKLGSHWSFNLRNDPKRLGFVLSRYKFTAKMACKNANILELGSSEGIGATILSEFGISYTGVDLDKSAIETAQQNLTDPKFKFIYDDFMAKTYGIFEAVVSLDVIEHILPEYEGIYFDTIMQNLSEKGICVIGTPNITSAPYAAETSKLGHVNLYSQERLISSMGRYFHHVLPFGMNDEIVHTGYSAMTHFLICIGIDRR